MNKLYNEKIKEEFLSTYDNEQTQKTIRNVFSKTQLIEDILGKDIYDFSLEEIGKAIANTNPFTKSVARSSGRFLSQYISWCIEPPHRYRKNTINPLKGVLSEWYDSFVDSTRKIHYSKDEFIDLLESLDNGQDQSFLALIWSGVLGERFSELTQLKFSDIDFENKTVHIKERDETITVEDFVIKYIEKAYNQKTYYYYNMNNKETTEKKLLDSPYIFKNVKSPRSQTEGQMVGISVIYNRLHSMKEITEIEHLTPNAIRQSGIIYYAVQVYLNEGILAYDQLAQVCSRFNWSIIENNNYRYYNTYLIKEFCNESTIKELYGIDVEFAKK